MRPDAQRQEIHEKARELIVENAQKGEMYRIVFEGDPQAYEGIPLALPGMTPADENVFIFKVLEPVHKRGTMRCVYRRIERMEPVV